MVVIGAGNPVEGAFSWFIMTNENGKYNSRQIWTAYLLYRPIYVLANSLDTSPVFVLEHYLSIEELTEIIILAMTGKPNGRIIINWV